MTDRFEEARARPMRWHPQMFLGISDELSYRCHQKEAAWLVLVALTAWNAFRSVAQTIATCSAPRVAVSSLSNKVFKVEAEVEEDEKNESIIKLLSAMIRSWVSIGINRDMESVLI